MPVWSNKCMEKKWWRKILQLPCLSLSGRLGVIFNSFFTSYVYMYRLFYNKHGTLITEKKSYLKKKKGNLGCS